MAKYQKYDNIITPLFTDLNLTANVFPHDEFVRPKLNEVGDSLHLTVKIHLLHLVKLSQLLVHELVIQRQD
jgi:hypothetical protein